MSTEGGRRRAWLPILIAVAALALLLAALRWAQAPPSGPVDPTWSRTACARCGMLVGEPGFAAQLHGPRGDVLHFDDPGCLLLWSAEHPGEEQRAWFHAAQRDEWLPADAAGFVPADPTPMGYGLAAVGAREPGALSREQALAAVRAREAQRAGARP